MTASSVVIPALTMAGPRVTRAVCARSVRVPARGGWLSSSDWAHLRPQRRSERCGRCSLRRGHRPALCSHRLSRLWSRPRSGGCPPRRAGQGRQRTRCHQVHQSNEHARHHHDGQPEVAEEEEGHASDSNLEDVRWGRRRQSPGTVIGSSTAPPR